MFCRNCGNQLADNAKFCNKCGNPVASAAAVKDPEPVIGDVIIPQDANPFEEANDFASREQASYQQEPSPYQQEANPYQQQNNPAGYQPYQPNYQQPYAQPYPYPQTSAVPGGNISKSSVNFIPHIIAMFILSIFMICSPLLKMFGNSSYSFGTASYLNDMSKLGDKMNKNVFSFTFEQISEGDADTKFMLIGFWVHALFEAVAFIFLVLAVFRLFSKRQDKQFKVLSDLRISLVSSFIGIIGVIGCMIASYMNYRNSKFSGVFSDVIYVWGYIFFALSLISLIVCSVFRGMAKRQFNRDTSYNAMAAQDMQNRFQQQNNNF
ncbi:MAG: zinc-ribbon domain-containing protein [Ruminococcus sp.]|nr:zinc-ribbon domain-containing protein [Ruminococcus sp.]